jgi:hypothetical protein
MGPDGGHDLVLYQAIMQRFRPAVREVTQRRGTEFIETGLRLQDLHPDIQRLFKKLRCRTFLQNDWWSAVYTDKGMIVDTFA